MQTAPPAPSRSPGALPAPPRLLLGDGAMGTELLRRGAAGATLAANLDLPDLVRAVHRDHLAAGARCVTTNTFLAPHLVAGGDAAAAAAALDAVRAAVLLARREADAAPMAAGPSARPLLVGDLGPTAPATSPATATHATRVVAEALLAGGCDALHLETFTSGAPLAAAAVAVAELLPAGSGRLWLSAVPRGAASGAAALPFGAEFFAALAAGGALDRVGAVGCNCGPGHGAAAWCAVARNLARLLDAVDPAGAVALLLSPPRPHDEPAPAGGADAPCATLDPLVGHLRGVAGAGRRVVLKGCCGVGPATIARWRALLAGG